MLIALTVLKVYLIIGNAYFWGLMFKVRLLGSPSDYHELENTLYHHGHAGVSRMTARLLLLCVLMIAWPYILWLRLGDIKDGRW